MKTLRHLLPLLAILFATPLVVVDAQQKQPTEDDIYRMLTFALPDDVQLEVGGMDWLDADKSRLAVCTRRSELWVLDNVYADPPVREGQKIQRIGDDGKTIEVDATEKEIVRYKRMLFGLHEPLGVVVNPGNGFPSGIYMAQRSELTRVADNNQDDHIDDIETFNKEWEISGGYHEYAFGPKIGKDGQLWVTLNRPFGGGQEATALWRGWCVKVDKDGKMTPVCPGLRSPAGLGTSADGEMFYTDNQGDHVAAGKLAHLKPGVFHGNPTGLESLDHPLANFKLPFKDYPKKGMKWGDAVKENPQLIAPAIWFPYSEMGSSQTDILTDTTGGKFGPFAGQMFVGDLGQASVMRVFLEKIDGEYQGVCFPFRRDFTPPVLRMLWGRDGSMFAGGSSRGWGGGKTSYGLARLVWTGLVPFEIHEMRARPTGFELTFTQPVDPKTASDVNSYKLRSWTYNYYDRYGDDHQDEAQLTIKSAKVAADARSVMLEVDPLRAYYVHALNVEGLRNAEGMPLLHSQAYYTLNRIPK